jgi:uncharacterized protein YjcR
MMLKAGPSTIDLIKMFNKMRIALALIDRKRNVLWRNRIFRTWFENRDRNRTDDFLYADEISRIIRKRRVFHFERAIWINDKNEKYFSFSVVPLQGTIRKDGIRILLTAFDVTEKNKIRLKAEKLSNPFHDI